MAQALRYLDLCIRQQVADELRTQLPVLGLGDLPQGTLDALFVRFASVCYEYDSAECMAVLLDTFSEAYYTGGLDYEAYIFTLRALPDLVLRYVAQHVPESSPVYFLEQLSATPQTPGVLDGIHRCVTLFGVGAFLPADVATLRTRALDRNHADVAAALGQLWSEVMPDLARPTWLVPSKDGLVASDVLDALADTHADARRATPMPTLSLTAAIELALAGMDARDPERPQAVATLRAALQSMTDTERYATLQPLHTTVETLNLYDDMEIQRVHGPANPLLGADLTLDDVCSTYGGCRMLLCTCFEEDEEYEEERAEDWYTGMCDGCDRAIAQRWYAVRLPLAGGGWRGCYCSTRCMRPRADTLLQTLLINNLDAQLTDTGIYDRMHAGQLATAP